MFEQEVFKPELPKPRAVWGMANENPPLMGVNIPEATQTMSLEESVVIFGRLTEKESQETMTGKTVVISKKTGDIEKSNDNKPKENIQQEDSKGESKEHDVEESSESKEHDVEESSESKEHDVEESSESKERVMRKEDNIETTEKHLEGKEEHNEEHTEEDEQIKSIDKHVGSEEEHVEKIKENVESKQEIKMEDNEEEHLENKEEIPDDPRKMMKTIPSEDVSAVKNGSGNQYNEKHKQNEVMMEQEEILAGVKEAWIVESSTLLDDVKSHDFSMDGNSNTQVLHIDNKSPGDSISIPDKQSESKSSSYQYESNQDESVPFQAKGVPEQSESKLSSNQYESNQDESVPFQAKGVPEQSESKLSSNQYESNQDESMPFQAKGVPEQSESKSSSNQYESNQDESVPLQAKGVPANKIFHLLQKRNETENEITSIYKVLNDYTLLNIEDHWMYLLCPVDTIWKCGE